MINMNFDPNKDDPSYYYLDQNGCPYMTKEEYESHVKEVLAFGEWCKQQKETNASNAS